MKRLPFNALIGSARTTALVAMAMAPADMGGGIGTLERKDDGGAPAAPKVPDTGPEAIKEFMGAWGEFQVKNDERLKAIEKGLADPIGEAELKKINTALDKMEGMNQKLTQAEKTADAVAELDKKFDQIETVLNRINKGMASRSTEEERAMKAADWAKAAVKAIQYTDQALGEDERKFITDVVDEYKALNIGTNTEGGYLAPVEMVREIIKEVTEISPVRSLARVRQTGMRSLEIPKRTGQFAAQWVSELGTKTETTGLQWGVHEITTHELFALVDLTNQLLEDSVFNVAQEVQTEAAEQFALAEGTAFVLGSGNGQPEGFLNHADVGVTNSGTAITIEDADGQANGILQMKYSLKSAYAGNASWVLNRTTMGQVRTLKDAQKNYIWQPGIAQGRPNSIDGDPYVEMPDMPNAGAGARPIGYGDFRRGYTWVDRIAMELLRDPYTQATGGKIRYIMRKRVAGKVTLGEAIKVLQCAV
jgi:HK97 family phage major capsid protein